MRMRGRGVDWRHSLRKLKKEVVRLSTVFREKKKTAGRPDGTLKKRRRAVSGRRRENGSFCWGVL